VVTAVVVRHPPARPLVSSTLPRAEGDAESERAAEAGPSTNLCNNNNNDNNTTYHYNSDGDADDDWGMEGGSRSVTSRADEEMEEVETNTEGHMEIGEPKGGEDEGYPHKESSEIRVDEEMGEAGMEAERSMEIGGPNEGFLPDAGSQYYQEDVDAPQSSSAEEDDFIPLSDLASSPGSSYASVEDEEEHERRERATWRAAIQAGVEEIDLTHKGSSLERDISMSDTDDEASIQAQLQHEDTDDEASIQAQLQHELRQSQESTAEANEAEEEDEVDYAAELARHLLSFHGCDDGAHQQAYDQHFADESHINNHYSLADITHITGRLPGVIDNPGIMKSDSPIRRNPIDWRLAFEGLRSDGNDQEGGEDGEGDERIHVCLHSSEQRRQPTRARFDIDSMVGFAGSLAFAKHGIRLDLAPQFINNFQTNLHLYYPVTQHTARGPKQVQAPLQDITHYRLGRVIGQEDIDVYVLFPADYDPKKPTNFPGKKGGRKHGFLQDWTDNILLPALARHVPSDEGQRIPGSWLSAR
jgi:hypothetical protein